ncbi:SsgA family sporulation/cell division regulator [Phytohabitans sp. ZYX-F-186]|uniref:Sporulation-specific cell division protein SsgB n=3 Tax=Phytohabitans TaxID=907364 RepID=A0A6F8YZY6_9ACTN|nr:MULTISPECIES: SsgA family sporulation/cell division regulator [Phytohabitans]MDQ7906438.1 SsgA family sporulation/cell division regulator [Phytohabitans sp. ZYX-F-186]BCB91626.1 sporulation-specific cell division protein SsgB [Phytohabitans suffuscus]GFJ75923.1 sporulation-specific cell division protein SsgB [Phytohabitans houttuyneae]
MATKRSAWQLLEGHAYSATVDGRVSVGLGYAADDPYAVHLIVSADATAASCWVFARDLLIAGLTGTAGQGDVLVGLQPGGTVVSVVLRNGRDVLGIDLPRLPLCRFAADMLAIVPRGSEAGHVDLDAELRSLLA